MKVLVTYDVRTIDAEGKRRLRKVSKTCQDYGVRVQNSVFECVVNSTEFVELKYKLIKIINEKEDSLRFYRLGENYRSKVEHVGAKPAIEVEDSLII